MGWDGMGWMDGSLGLVEYRAPYGANNNTLEIEPLIVFKGNDYRHNKMLSED